MFKPSIFDYFVIVMWWMIKAAFQIFVVVSEIIAFPVNLLFGRNLPDLWLAQFLFYCARIVYLIFGWYVVMMMCYVLCSKLIRSLDDIKQKPEGD